MKYPTGQSCPSTHYKVRGLPTRSSVQSTEVTHDRESLSA